MNDAHRVQVRRRGENLAQVTRRFLLPHRPSLLHHIRQRPIRTQLHQDVHVRVVLKTSHEPHHVSARHRSMNINLREHLRSRARLYQRRLTHHFTRVLRPTHRVLHRIHHRKPASTERTQPNVPPRRRFPSIRRRSRRFDDDARALHLSRSVRPVTRANAVAFTTSIVSLSSMPQKLNKRNAASPQLDE